VHYVSLCGGGVITRLIVADLSGHGEALTEQALALRSLLRRNINRKDQGRLVRTINQQFMARAQADRFATAIIATSLTSPDELTLCNAGHPRPLWYRAAENAWSFLEGDREPVATFSDLPLGVDEETAYSQFTVPLGKGDVVFLYTDALIEATNDAGKQLTPAGLLELAHRLDVSEPARLGPALLASLERYRGGKAADDDVTVLALYHTGGHPPRLSLVQQLDVYAKVFGLKRI